jgi:uncharacterized protein YlbG (UPF0298 family)
MVQYIALALTVWLSASSFRQTQGKTFVILYVDHQRIVTVSLRPAHVFFSNQTCEDRTYADKSTRFAHVYFTATGLNLLFCKMWKFRDMKVAVLDTTFLRAIEPSFMRTLSFPFSSNLILLVCLYQLKVMSMQRLKELPLECKVIANFNL